MGRLVDALVGGLEVRTSTTVRGVERDARGWRLTLGSAAAPETVRARTVVLATPAAPAARLLGEVAPAASRELATVEAASVAVVSLAFEASAVAGLEDRSGFLVPAVEGPRGVAPRAGVRSRRVAVR